MKVELEIPDWVVEEERGIHILAGIEHVASYMPWEKVWKVKVSRCSQCGLCCKKTGCPFLEQRVGETIWNCSKGVERPWLCCIGESKDIAECTSRYEAAK